MKYLDYFYENYLLGAIEVFKGVGEFVLSGLLWFVCAVTIPLWIVPYLLWKKKGGE